MRLKDGVASPQSTFNFGSGLRKLYVDRHVRTAALHTSLQPVLTVTFHPVRRRLKFLPDVVHSNDEIYLRTTNIPRTIESLQQILHGLYPVSKSAQDFVPHLRIR